MLQNFLYRNKRTLAKARAFIKYIDYFFEVASLTPTAPETVNRTTRAIIP